MSDPLSPDPIPFIDLVAQRRRLGRAVDQAIARVAAHGRLILGPEVEAFEAELGAFCAVPHVVTCASGTDAMTLVLRALGVGPGDAVIVPAFTFAATAGVVAGVGATPVFVDVRAQDFALDPAQIGAGVARARDLGLRPVGVIPVDLFGQPAEHAAIAAAASAAGLWVLVDAAQGFGGRRDGRPVGGFGLATAVSFYPSKPLGAYGDGGAVLTADAGLAGTLRALRNHGAQGDPYRHDLIGTNSRLDAIQAAILRAKLAIFPEEIAARHRAAARYARALDGLAIVPRLAPGASSVWAQYTLRLPGDRAAIRAHMAEAGIPTAVHYPMPLHHQPAYRRFPTAAPRLPVAERLAGEVLSLPMHGYLTPSVQDRVIAAFRAACALAAA